MNWPNYRAFYLFLASFTSAATLLHAWPSRADDLRSEVSNAQQLIGHEKWHEARMALDRADASCHLQGDPRSCRDLVDYSFAYLAQSVAEALPESRETNLREAERRYQAVLVHVPDNAATLNNLAQVEELLLSLTQDPPERQALIALVETRLQKAITVDPQRASYYELRLGDFLVSQKRSEEALPHYRRALSSPARSELAFQRILDYSAPEAATCQGWESSAPLDLTARCYEKIMRAHSTAASGEDNIADDALLRWTSLVARHDMLTPERLKALPQPWRTPAVNELQTYLQDPLREPGSIWRWWWSEPRKAAITADVAVAVGRQLLDEGPSGAAKAEKCWEAFLNAQPHLMDYVVMESHSPTRSAEDWLPDVLLLYQELASLYNHHPDLDPKNAKLKDMIGRLFGGKAVFLRDRNWRATQSFHTTLALIFAERGAWGQGRGDSNDPMGATYQLKAALDDAVKRQGDPLHYFQPLPDLKALLAKAYIQIERPADARTEYLRAAIAYLDVDAFDRADEMLRLAGNDDPASAILAKIISLRRHPDKVSLPALNLGKSPWLFSAQGTLDSAFLSRQRFKILADLATAPGIQNPSERLDAAFRAYGESESATVTLVGTADLLRYQAAENVLLASANAESHGLIVEYATGTPDSEKVPLSLPGQQGPSYVKRDPQASVAEKIVTTIGPLNTYTVRPYIKVENGKLVAVPDPDDSQIGPIFEQLANNPDLHLTIIPPQGTV